MPTIHHVTHKGRQYQVDTTNHTIAVVLGFKGPTPMLRYIRRDGPTGRAVLKLVYRPKPKPGEGKADLPILSASLAKMFGGKS